MSGLYSADRLLNLLAAVDALPARHDCRGLQQCRTHPRWHVWQAEAVAYATARARAAELAQAHATAQARRDQLAASGEVPC